MDHVQRIPCQLAMKAALDAAVESVNRSQLLDVLLDTPQVDDDAVARASISARSRSSR